MKRFFNMFLRPAVSQNDLLQKDQLYLRVSLKNITLFCAICHMIYCFFFLFLQIWPFVILNVVSVIIYLVLLAIAANDRLALTGIGISAEISFFVFISVLFLGNGYYLLLLIFDIFTLQFTLPYAHLTIRRTIGITLAVFLALLLLLGDFTHPPIHLMGLEKTFFTMLNVFISFTAISLEGLYLPKMRNALNRYLKHQVEKLKSDAYIDPLTQLYNRRYASLVFDRLNKMDDRVNWHVAIMDIDDFKSVNDDYGHMIGDQVLQKVSDTARECLRATDFAFRWGGEEFLFLVKTPGVNQAFIVLDRMRQRIASSVVYHDHVPVHVTVTIGIVPLDLNDVSRSIEACDRKMYKGKHIGKNIAII